MLALDLLILVTGVLSGTAAHLPGTVTALLAAVIAVILLGLALRERRAGRALDATYGPSAFAFGLIGLLVGNLVLGLCAAGLALTALRQRPARHGLAVAALLLGVADLAVLGALVAADDTWSWSYA